jgi:hypothetical protein
VVNIAMITSCPEINRIVLHGGLRCGNDVDDPDGIKAQLLAGF